MKKVCCENLADDREKAMTNEDLLEGDYQYT
jgi:hypothetical protein